MPEETQPGLRIASVQIENVKSVKAFHMEPTPLGLTIVGGKNGQGKTSVLDAIAWVLGGAKKAPSKAARNGAMSDPSISLTLSNGIRVERKGKNSTLTVIDPMGKRSGQALLDAFVSEFALDLPKFMDASNRDKAQILLRILGVGDQLAKLDQAEARLYNERHSIGQTASAKAKHAEELPEFPDVPTEPLSISELIMRQQSTLARNGENQRKREALDHYRLKLDDAARRVELLKQELAAAQENWSTVLADFDNASKSAQDLEDESTAELEQQIADFESLNAQIAANAQKQAARDEAEHYQAQYDAKDMEITKLRNERMALLNDSPLPLPGLSVVDGELVYNGQRWDCMSSSEQLRVAVAIVRKLKPECAFVLMDKLEQMDLDTLAEFGAWLTTEGLQVIATRVSTGDECSIIIEDGLPAGKSYADVITGIDATPAMAMAIPEEF